MTKKNIRQPPNGTGSQLLWLIELLILLTVNVLFIIRLLFRNRLNTEYNPSKPLKDSIKLKSNYNSGSIN